MDYIKIVDRLVEQANVSYKDAKEALEKSNWDILDATLYLEEKGIIPKPAVSVYSTNEYKENYKETNSDASDTKSGSSIENFFEVVCNIIDKGNNIFFKIKREKKVLVELPITVMILLLIFSFWITVPLAIVALFFNIEFSLSGHNIEKSKINYFFKSVSENVENIKESIKKGLKND